MLRLAGERNAWADLAGRLVAWADRAESAGASAELLHEAAVIRLEHGVPADAEELLRRILGIRPDDAAARAGLEKLYRATGRWSDLATALEERVDPRFGNTAPEKERQALLAELARLYDQELGNPYEAIAALERLAAATPGDIEVHEKLAGLYEKVGRWAKGIEALARVADLADGTARARAARGRMADIYENELELPERARALRAQLRPFSGKPI
jgi:tetratricopeptide (TPR) repeat protein